MSGQEANSSQHRGFDPAKGLVCEFLCYPNCSTFWSWLALGLATPPIDHTNGLRSAMPTGKSVTKDNMQQQESFWQLFLFELNIH